MKDFLIYLIVELICVAVLALFFFIVVVSIMSLFGGVA